MSARYDRNTLVASLNALLESLEIPITLYDALELTPFLILAIFESMLRTRLPIPQETRRTVTRASRIEAMKVFLGVLEDDVLGVDVGLEELDPRRLADGEEEEVVYVGEVLCWLGKKMHYITKEGLPARTTSLHRRELLPLAGPERPSSPSTLSTSLKSSLSLHDSVAESQTTIAQDSFDDGTPINDEYERASIPSYHHTDDMTDSFDYTASQSRIYDVEDFPASPQKRRAERLPTSDFEPSFEEDEPLASDSEGESFCDCPEDLSMCSTVHPSIRTDGYISNVNVDSEIRSFEAWREASTRLRTTPRLSESARHSLSSLKTPPRGGGPSQGIVTRHTSPAQHTLALMDERARLLSELAKLKSRRK